jgi:hypothetical protein
VWSHDGGELLAATGSGALLAFAAPVFAQLDTSASYLAATPHREVALPAALAQGLSRRAGASRRVPGGEEQAEQPAGKAEGGAGQQAQQQQGGEGGGEEAPGGAKERQDAAETPRGSSGSSSACPAEVAQDQCCSELMGVSPGGALQQQQQQQQQPRPAITALCRQPGQPGGFLLATSSSRSSASGSLWRLQLLPAGEQPCLLPLLPPEASAALAPPACPAHPASARRDVSHLTTTEEGRLLLLGFRDGRVAAVELAPELQDEQQPIAAATGHSSSSVVWVSSQHDLMSGGVTAVAAVPALALLASAAEDGSMCLHQLQSGQLGLPGTAGAQQAASAEAEAGSADGGSAGAEDLGEDAPTLEQAKQRAQQDQLVSAAGGCNYRVCIGWASWGWGSTDQLCTLLTLIGTASRVRSLGRALTGGLLSHRFLTSRWEADRGMHSAAYIHSPPASPLQSGGARTCCGRCRPSARSLMG